MKKILSFSLITIAITLFFGCSKFVEGYDVSPNSPSDVPASLLLPTIEIVTFSNYTGKNARDAGVLTQQFKGQLFQSQELQNYFITESSIDGDWTQIYDKAVINCNTLITKAGDSNKGYRGIAKILKAMNLGLATDYWGDVPSKEAGLGIEGETKFNATFDSQENVIKDIQTLLSEGIADLNASANDIENPGEHDLVFGGKAAKWVGAAWVLKARYANRLSKIDPAKSATDAISFLAEAYKAGFTSNTSNLNAVFDNTIAGSSNQWKAFEGQRAGYMTLNNTLLNIMTGMNDPRLAKYATANTTGGFDEKSKFGTFATGEKIPMVSFMEAKFIEAEAQLRANAKDKAATAFNDAVKASVLLVTGADNAAFNTAEASTTDATITQEKIMTHKYVAMYTQPEVWSDWRRTDIPKLTPNTGASVAFVPRRYPTALSERLYNTKAVVVSKLDEKVWWDK